MRRISVDSVKKYKYLKVPKKKKSFFSFLQRKNKKDYFFKNKSFEKKPNQIILKNPVGARDKSKNRNKIKIIFLIFSFFVWICFLLYHPYFRINKITYYGLNTIEKEEIESYIKENYLNGGIIFPKKNYFFVNPEKMIVGLNKKYVLEKIEIKKIFPNQLIVDVEEKNSSIIYDNGTKYFLLDSAGGVIKFLGNVKKEIKLTNTFSSSTSISSSTTRNLIYKPDYRLTREEYGNFPLVFDKRLKEISEKDKNILSKKYINGILGWQRSMNKEGIIVVKYYEIENPLSGIMVYSTGNLLIYFNPIENLKDQVENLKIILRDFNPKEYVDLRYGEKLYWR